MQIPPYVITVVSSTFVGVIFVTPLSSSGHSLLAVLFTHR